MRRRILVTDALDLVGPACVQKFGELGDDVYPELDRLNSRDTIARLVAHDPEFDVVVANRALPEGGLLPDQIFGKVIQPLLWTLHGFVEAMTPRGCGTIAVPIAATDGPSKEMVLAAQRSVVASIGSSAAAFGLRINAVESRVPMENPKVAKVIAERIAWLASPNAALVAGRIVDAAPN